MRRANSASHLVSPRCQVCRCLIAVALLASISLTLATPSIAGMKREHVLGAKRGVAAIGTVQKATSVDGSADAIAIVHKITGATGIPMTNFEVRASEDVPNALATTERSGERLILYNPRWMDNFKSSIATNWSDWVVLAHEVGHHVAFHLDPTFPNHDAELQADYFAGFILNRLGAPAADVQLAVAMVATDAPSESHPAKSERVAWIRKGWDAAATNVGANVIPAVATGPIHAAMTSPGTPRVATPPAERRVALLIGNSNYKTWGNLLKNPKNDVIAVGRELRGQGFETTVIYDGMANQISTAIKAFGDEAKDADLALIYYAGTGIEAEGVNYIIPIDADDRRALSFADDHPEMRLDTAFDAVAGAKKLRLVIADACRIDPAVTLGKVEAGAGNLKVVQPPRGVIVAYSTSAGQFASDGAGELSSFAEGFVSGLREPGLELQKMLRRISAAVEKSSNGTQVPTVIGNWPADDVVLSK